MEDGEDIKGAYENEGKEDEDPISFKGSVEGKKSFRAYSRKNSRAVKGREGKKVEQGKGEIYLEGEDEEEEKVGEKPTVKFIREEKPQKHS